MSNDSINYLTKLHILLDQNFNLQEIETLRFQLGVNKEFVAGTEKSVLIRGLLNDLGQDGRLLELVALAQKQRLRTAWPSVPDNFEMPASLDEQAVWDGRFPYLGLKAYQETDAEFFFGREELVDYLLTRLLEARFIVIAGPSGSGKSSVARAGLFHALREGRVEASEKWVLATMSPKDKPIENLALALGRDGGDREAARVIREEGLKNPLTLHEQVELLKAMSDDPHRRFVLLVDQFEELFTQTKDDEAREAFIKLLTTAAGVEGGRTIILLSLRSDFVSNCALYPELREQINKKNQFQLVGAMEPRDLAKAITLPSLEVGAEIEPALVKEIIDDMKGEPGALPLMSFALRDLFLAEKTTKGAAMDMTLQEYVDRGGIDQALERHANQVFDSFSEEQQELAKGIFSKLITVGEGRLDTRRTALFEELKPADADAAAVATVVGMLSAESVRLVTTSGVESEEELTAEEMATNELAYAQTTVTIAHEKLIDAWPWLHKLIDENRELIALQNQLNRDAREWEVEEDAGILYRGGRLLHLEENLDQLQPSLDELSLRFIQASIDERQRLIDEKETQRRRELEQAQQLAEEEQRRSVLFRRALIGGSLLALFLLAALVFAGVQTNNAANEAKAARTAEVKAEAETTRAVLQSERALAQSLQANSRALVSNQPNNQELAQARLLAVGGADVNDRVGSPDEKTASAGLLFSLGYEQPIAYQPETTLSEHTSSVWSVAWNGDGSRLASASDDSTVIIWDTESWEAVTTLSDHTNEVISVAWNGDGSRLASASNDNTVIIWEFPDFARLQCQLAGRNLSLAEWEEFLPGVDYRCTCEEWPAGEGAPPDAPGCSK